MTGLLRWWRGRADRCAHCGHPFRRRSDARHAWPNAERRVYHGPCMDAIKWRTAAEERLRVLAIVTDLTGWTGRDVTDVVEMRARDDAERVRVSNEVFRVFHALTAGRDR